MDFPKELKYTKEHEWVKVDEENKKVILMGITDYAQDSLGDIVFVELPSEGDLFDKESPMGVVESVKAVSDIFSPISGEVIEINDGLKETPETLNADPYGEGWIVKLEMKHPDELNELMDSKAYEKYLEELED